LIGVFGTVIMERGLGSRAEGPLTKGGAGRAKGRMLAEDVLDARKDRGTICPRGREGVPGGISILAARLMWAIGRAQAWDHQR